MHKAKVTAFTLFNTVEQPDLGYEKYSTLFVCFLAMN
jgi:hypothetical protein